MPYLVTFGDNGLSAGVTLVAEQPETLGTGEYFTEVESEFFRYKKDGSTIRSATQAEIDAEIAELTAAAAENMNRRKRDALLADCDWVVVKSLEEGATVPAAWVTYRQALRDMPDHTEWPLVDENDWPTAP